MENRTSNLLDEALGLDHQTKPWPLTGKVVVIEDCVETSGSFVLHHLIKQIFAPNSSNIVIFLAFSHPFSHYDRILRKLGCNLAAQRDNNRFFFFDMLKLPDANGGKTAESGFITLFGKIQKLVGSMPQKNKEIATIMIDDVSLMEVAAGGSSDIVLDFLHYCHTLTSDVGCSLVALNHEDIYSSMERPVLLLQMEYLAHVLVNAEPLATGLAADVHGQLTVMNRENCNERRKLKIKTSNFQFMIKENGVQYFYPGSRT